MQFIEINVNTFSRIPNEWSELHVEKKKQFERATRAENLKKSTFYIKFSKIFKVRLLILFFFKIIYSVNLDLKGGGGSAPCPL